MSFFGDVLGGLGAAGGQMAQALSQVEQQQMREQELSNAERHRQESLALNKAEQERKAWEWKQENARRLQEHNDRMQQSDADRAEQERHNKAMEEESRIRAEAARTQAEAASVRSDATSNWYNARAAAQTAGTNFSKLPPQVQSAAMSLWQQSGGNIDQALAMAGGQAGVASALQLIYVQASQAAEAAQLRAAAGIDLWSGGMAGMNQFTPRPDIPTPPPMTVQQPAPFAQPPGPMGGGSMSPAAPPDTMPAAPPDTMAAAGILPGIVPGMPRQQRPSGFGPGRGLAELQNANPLIQGTMGPAPTPADTNRFSQLEAVAEYERRRRQLEALRSRTQTVGPPQG